MFIIGDGSAGGLYELAIEEPNSVSSYEYSPTFRTSVKALTFSLV
jgi:hypothetical protein